MTGKENDNIRTIRPLREGVIADFYAAEQMMRGLIKRASNRSRWFTPSLRIVIGIPSGSTEVEIRAVRDSADHAGGRDIYMIYEPMAAALGTVLYAVQKFFGTPVASYFGLRAAKEALAEFRSTGVNPYAPKEEVHGGAAPKETFFE